MSPVLEAPAATATEITSPETGSTSEISLPISVMEIMDTIPHRYPFLLVDRITAFEPGKFVRSYKNVTINEPFFQGHFPGLPIMPGVLQIEAMAQTGAFLMRHLLSKNSGKIAVLTGIDNFRFRRVVKPGDQLVMEGELLRFRAPLGKARCKAFVDGQIVAEGEILFSMVDAEQIQ